MEIAVLVNLKARRGSESVARACQEAMPSARVLCTSTPDEAAGFTDDLRRLPPDLVVSAGGDGTAVQLLTAMRSPVGGIDEGARDVLRRGQDSVSPFVSHPKHPALALLPLGTGNGWAHATGAPRWKKGVERLGIITGGGAPLPLSRYDLIEVCGRVAPFAGTGWDAEVLDDYHHIKTSRYLPKVLRMGLPGYMFALGTRTIPHGLFQEPAEVEVTNLGDDAFVIDESGKAVRVVGGGYGRVLYRGPMRVAGSGTSPDLGFGFRALPHADTVPGRFCTRVYAAPPVEAIRRIPALWRGQHPLPHSYSWLLTGCRMSFSRPVPFQIGGDRLGLRTEIEYHLAHQPVDVLDWRAVAAAMC